MFKKKIICLIPTKKKSSQIKNKNMLKIDNKPLIYYTLKEAIKSKYIDEIFLSSDCDKILKYAEKFGINTLKRPKSISLKTTKASQVIDHFVSKIKLEFEKISIIYLQPTSPLRKVRHIDDAIKLHIKSNKKCVISVSAINNTILKSFIFNKKKLVPLAGGKYIGYNRQELPRTFKPNGAIYIFSITSYKKLKNIPYNNSIPYIMNSADSIDLDTLTDLKKIKKTINEKK